MLVCVSYYPWHARPRVQRAPGFPCALFFLEGLMSCMIRTHPASRKRKRTCRHLVPDAKKGCRHGHRRRLDGGIAALVARLSRRARRMSYHQRCGIGSRMTRLPVAKIIAQPMRRQHRKEGFHSHSHALQESGDGKIFELKGMRWSRVRSTSFGGLPKLQYRIGYALASLEVIEWIILSKEQDFSRYGNDGSFFMKSLPGLLLEKTLLLELIAQLRGGLWPQESDRAVE